MITRNGTYSWSFVTKLFTVSIYAVLLWYMDANGSLFFLNLTQNTSYSIALYCDLLQVYMHL